MTNLEHEQHKVKAKKRNTYESYVGRESILNAFRREYFQ